MRGYTGVWALLAAIGYSAAAGGMAVDADAVKPQKEAALANWKQFYGDEAPAEEETAHLLIYGPAAMPSGKLRQLGADLEVRYALARKALKVDPQDELWPGKLTVYLIDNRRHFSPFIRPIAKQRPRPDDSGAWPVRAPYPFVAACPPQMKYDPSLEAQAGEQVVAAVLAKRGGEGIPEWLRSGFARATAWRVMQAAAFNDRNQV